MKNFCLICITLFCFFHAKYAFSAAISAELLFGNPASSDFKLSPDSKYVSAIFYSDSGQSLILNDPNLNVSVVLMDFPFSKSSRIRSYQWIDSDSIHLVVSSRNTQKQIIINLNFNGEKVVPNVGYINSRGFIIDIVKGQDNKVLFARKVGGGKPWYKVYTIDIVDLVRGRFKDAVEFQQPLPDANYYFSGFDNDVMIAARLEEDQPAYYYLNSRNKWVKFWSTTDDEISFQPIGSLGNDKIAVLSNRQVDKISLWEFDLKSNNFGRVIYQHPKYDLSSAKIDKANKSIEFVRYFDHGRLKTEYFKNRDEVNARILSKAFPSKQIITVSGALNGEKSIVFVFSSNDPGSYYLFNSKTKTAQLLDSRYPDLEPTYLTKNIVITAKSSDGSDIEALISRPDKDDLGVLLVVPHGGPIGIRDIDFYSPETQYLTSRGYSVLRVNFAGSSGFGRVFQKRGEAQFGRIIEEDITKVVNHVRSVYSFNHICSMGTSYGGYSAVMLAIYHPEVYQCVIGMYGVYDLPLLFNSGSKNNNPQFNKSLVKILGKNRPELKDVSPYHLAKNIKSPVLLFAGTNDQIADYEQTNRLNYRMKQLGLPLEYVLYQGVGHGHHRWIGEHHQYAYIDDFIKRSLGINSHPSIESRSAYQYDGEVLGDFSYYGGMVAKNHKLAARFYKSAALLGSIDAMLQLGHLYQNGEGLKSDVDESIMWFTKAAGEGSKNASFRLGEIYNDSALKRTDKTQSLKYFNLAKEQGHELAKFGIGRGFCQYNDTSYNLTQCLKVLDLSDPKNKRSVASQNRRNSILEKLVWKPMLSLPELERIKKLLKEDGSVDQFTYSFKKPKPYIAKERDGLFGSYLHESKSTIFPLKSGNRFGIRLKGENNSGALALVKIRWSGPKQTDDQFIDEGLAFFNANEELNLYYQLSDSDSLRHGKWKVEVFTIDGAKLFEQEFKSKRQK